MVYADLHVHTTASDGELVLDDVPAAARSAGVSVVAVTDHDRLHPDLDAAVETRDGVTVVRGVELRVAAGDQRVDLLGYAARDTTDLSAELDRLQADRAERAHAVVDCVGDRLGVTLDVDLGPGVGRPHVARAVAAHPDAPYDYQGAFDHLIGDDCACFVPRDVTAFDEGVRLLDDACALVALAHPLRYPDPAAALALTRRLDAVERWYPYDRPVDLGPVDDAVERHGLVPTGGSDAHGTDVGAAGLDEAAYDRVATRLD